MPGAWVYAEVGPDGPHPVALELLAHARALGLPVAAVALGPGATGHAHSLGAHGVPKTSGADGLHVYIPLPPKTPYDAGLLLCQIVATVVSNKHPKAATIERAVRSRGRRVYIDYLQNIPGKTLATAYSARASDYAGVSTPLSWVEIGRGVKREDFTIETIAGRLEDAGDLWKALRTSKGIDLSRVERYAKRAKGV